MKLLIASIVFIVTLIGCAKPESSTVYITTVTPEPSPSVSVEVKEVEKAKVSFEGYYELENGGWADIYEDAQGLVTARSLKLVMANQDGSLGTMPMTSFSSLGVANEAVYQNSNQTYTSALNVKTDVGNSALNAAYSTELKLTKANNKLQIKVKVLVNSGVIVDHNVSSL